MSSGAFPLEIRSSDPFISPALDDSAQSGFIGKARIKDVEEKLGT
jgi:hypothetical protein